MVLIVEKSLTRKARPDIAEPREIPGETRLHYGALATPPWPGPPVPRPSTRRDPASPEWKPL